MIPLLQWWTSLGARYHAWELLVGGALAARPLCGREETRRHYDGRPTRFSKCGHCVRAWERRLDGGTK